MSAALKDFGGRHDLLYRCSRYSLQVGGTNGPDTVHFSRDAISCSAPQAYQLPCYYILMQGAICIRAVGKKHSWQALSCQRIRPIP